MSIIYLDNAATTQTSRYVFEQMMPYLKDQYGNPSSNYSLGLKARKAKEAAREKVASLINAEPEEIFFTSGATEANNWMLHSVLDEFRDIGSIMISNIEHASIWRSLEYATKDRYQIVRCSGTGEIHPFALERRFRSNKKRITLLSIMMVNNETGVINDIKSLAKESHYMYVPFHTDATQALGHIKIDVKDLCVDALSGSAHKIYGPKGVGFLYIRKRSTLYDIAHRHPYIIGGHQESGLRGGTENLAGIVGLGAACEETKIYLGDKDKEFGLKKMSNNMLDVLKKEVIAQLNNDEIVRSVPTLSVRIPGVKNHELIQLLDEENVCVSAGSACNENQTKPSHVLSSMGIKENEINETIRISIGRNNTESEIKTASEIIIDKVKTLKTFND